MDILTKPAYVKPDGTVYSPFNYTRGITLEQIEEAARAIVIKSAELSSTMNEPGLGDIRKTQLKACGLFAKALILERRFGKTTDECLFYLDMAIEAVPA
jgi:hypothetical protein